MRLQLENTAQTGTPPMNRCYWTLMLLLSLAVPLQSAQVSASQGRQAVPASPRPTSVPAVIAFSVIRADTAARFIHRFYPNARLVVDRDSNAIIVSATPDEVSAMRQIASGIDAKNPLSPTTQSVTLHRLDASDVQGRLRALYSGAKFSVIGRHTLLVSATNGDLQQMQALVSAIDAPATTPSPAVVVATPPSTEAIRILQALPKDVAREVAGAVHGLRVQVAGQSVILAGSPDLVQRAKDVITVLDAPPSGSRYTAVYRIRTLDAKSVADLLQRSFADVKISVDEDINSLSVFGTAAEQRRISDGIAQIDIQPSSGSSATASGSGIASVSGSGSVQVYTLKYALPGPPGASSSSATDLATMVTQTLASQTPDLHVTAAPTTPQLMLTGNPYSIKLAKDLLAQLDVAQRLVALDTEILEVDENTAKNLGLQLSNAVGGAFSFGALFSEIAPTPDPNTGVTPPLKRLRPLGRTGLGFIAVLNLAIEHGTARVLADPRITTLSGHTATIRAGDNISIQLQAGGGAGTIATTQIQTFQTGVTLDITPIVNDDGLITVALHPVVNSLTGILNGIPQISTRDTQTTVALKENETLVIGGLIQDNTQRTESRIPVLGDLPLVGRAFRNQTLNGNRNELIISVTPHILTPGQANVYPGPPLPAIPTPQALPSLPPGTVLPPLAPRPMPTGPPVTLSVTNLPLAPPVSTISATPPAKSFKTAPIATPSAVPTQPAPQALTERNTFTYGSPPAANFSPAGNGAEIYYARLAPTLLSYGQPISVTAITSANVARMSLSYNSVSLSLTQSGPGRWEATLPFTLIGTPSPIGAISLSLAATTGDGTQTAIAIPVTVVAQK